MWHTLILILVVLVVASLVLWFVREAPEQAIAADFKPIIRWVIVGGVVIWLVITVLRAAGAL